MLNGIIKTYPKVKIQEFLGDISYTGSALKNKAGKEPVPGGGDVRRVIQEYCILPMSKLLFTMTCFVAKHPVERCANCCSRFPVFEGEFTPHQVVPVGGTRGQRQDHALERHMFRVGGHSLRPHSNQYCGQISWKIWLEHVVAFSAQGE